jgi:hypothetical protein
LFLRRATEAIEPALFAHFCRRLAPFTKMDLSRVGPSPQVLRKTRENGLSGSPRAGPTQSILKREGSGKKFDLYGENELFQNLNFLRKNHKNFNYASGTYLRPKASPLS